MCCGEEKTSKHLRLFPRHVSHIYTAPVQTALHGASVCIQYAAIRIKVECMNYPINGRNDRFDDKSINKHTHGWIVTHHLKEIIKNPVGDKQMRGKWLSRMGGYVYDWTRIQKNHRMRRTANVDTSFPLSTSHNLAMVSMLPVATKVLWGLKARQT